MKFEYITKVPYSLSIACCKIRHACNLKWHITLADNTQYLWAELWYKRVLIGQRSSREAVCKSTWQRKTLYHRTPLVMGSAHVNWKRGSVWAVLAMWETFLRADTVLWHFAKPRPILTKHLGTSCPCIQTVLNAICFKFNILVSENCLNWKTLIQTSLSPLDRVTNGSCPCLTVFLIQAIDVPRHQTKDPWPRPLVLSRMVHMRSVSRCHVTIILPTRLYDLYSMTRWSRSPEKEERNRREMSCIHLVFFGHTLFIYQLVDILSVG